MTQEIWKKVPEWEDLYEVSNLGRVRSFDRKMLSKSKYWRILKGKVLKIAQHYDGYCVVRLCRHPIQKDYFIHRLVAKAFLPNSENLKEVNHRNGLRNDNRLENLEWISPLQNVHYSRDILREGRPPGATLTVADVREILRLSKEGLSAREIAERFNVHAASIRRIKRGATWKHLAD